MESLIVRNALDALTLLCWYVYHTQWQYLQRTNYPLNHQYSITKCSIVSNLSGLQWLHIFAFIRSFAVPPPMPGARKANFYSTSYYSYYWTEHLFNINWIKLSLLRSCMCLLHKCHIVYLKLQRSANIVMAMKILESQYDSGRIVASLSTSQHTLLFSSTSIH